LLVPAVEIGKGADIAPVGTTTLGGTKITELFAFHRFTRRPGLLAGEGRVTVPVTEGPPTNELWLAVTLKMAYSTTSVAVAETPFKVAVMVTVWVPGTRDDVAMNELLIFD